MLGAATIKIEILRESAKKESIRKYYIARENIYYIHIFYKIFLKQESRSVCVDNRRSKRDVVPESHLVEFDMNVRRPRDMILCNRYGIVVIYDTGIFHVKLASLMCHPTRIVCTSKQYRRCTFLQFKCVTKDAEYLLLRMR